MEDHVEKNTRLVPLNFGPMKGANGNARITGPCGDTMEFWLRVEENCIVAAKFTTDGCIHSLLCGSQAALMAEGKTLSEARQIEQQDVVEAVEVLPEDSQHCALLAVNTLKAAVSNYQARQISTLPSETCASCDSPQKKKDQTRKSRMTDRKVESDDDQTLRQRLAQIQHKILVMSGKGGVGKSTVAVNLAVALSLAGKQVGLLDVDIHGPSVPKMLGIEGMPIASEMGSILPVELGDMKVMSIGLLLEGKDEAVIWRGPMKMRVIKQFLKDVAWGELDYLVIDSPPGTGDEPLSICQMIDNTDGAIIVTTPQEIALADVRRSVNFCRRLHLPVLGVIENMSGFICPHCGQTTDIFKTVGGRRMAEEMHVPFLGTIPMDPQVVQACDNGRPYIHHYAQSVGAKAFSHIIQPILKLAKTVPNQP